MSSAQQKADDPSTFSERFEFARDRQRLLGSWQPDGALATAVGVSPSQMTEYKARLTAPASERTLALAKRIEVDPGWLAFGEDSKAPAPDGFTDWLARRRTARLQSRRAGQGPAEKRRGA
jgi:hypothetical protein